MLCNVWIKDEEKNCCDLAAKAQGDSCSTPKEHLQEICCESGSGNQNRGASFSLLHKVCEGENNRLRET